MQATRTRVIVDRPPPPLARRRCRLSAIDARDARHVALLAHEPGVAHAAPQRVVVGAVRGAEREVIGRRRRRAPPLSRTTHGVGHTHTQRGDVVARPSPFVHAHVLHPLSRDPPRHDTHTDAASNVRASRRDAGQKPPRTSPVAHASGAGFEHAAVEAHCARFEPAGRARAPEKPHSTASMDPGSAATRERRTREISTIRSSYPGPAPRGTRTSRPPAAVHTCISAPDFRHVTRASPRAHVGVPSSLTMLQSSPSKPGLQWHVPSRARRTCSVGTWGSRCSGGH